MSTLTNSHARKSTYESNRWARELWEHETTNAHAAPLLMRPLGGVATRTRPQPVVR